MSIADQVHDKIMGLLLNQIAFDFGVKAADMSPELEGKYYDAVTVKVSYETEIQKVLGPDSQMLGWGNVMALAEEITLEELFNSGLPGGVDEVADYMAKFPAEMKKWHDHLLTLLD